MAYFFCNRALGSATVKAMKPNGRRAENAEIFHKIRFYAVEVSATAAFLVWLARALWHELGL